jgi:hypothetical protein
VSLGGSADTQGGFFCQFVSYVVLFVNELGHVVSFDKNSVTDTFGNWFGALSNRLHALSVVGVYAFCWSLSLSRNVVVF